MPAPRHFSMAAPSTSPTDTPVTTHSGRTWLNTIASRLFAEPVPQHAVVAREEAGKQESISSWLHGSAVARQAGRSTSRRRSSASKFNTRPGHQHQQHRGQPFGRDPRHEHEADAQHRAHE